MGVIAPSRARARTTTSLKVAGIRADRSLGVARYVAHLAEALRAEGVEYRPASRPVRGLHAHFHLANSSRGFLWRAPVLGGLTVVTVHDVVPRTRALSPLYRAAFYPALGKVDAVVFHSAHAADLLQRAGAAPRRLEVIPHAVPATTVERDDAVRALGWQGEAPLAVLPGVLKSAKLVEETLTAAEPLVRNGSLRLALVGPAADTRVVRSAQKLGATVLTDADDGRYEQAIAAADVVLVLRRESVGESNGPLLDALGAGRAVLATRTGSIPEVAGHAAWYCEPTATGIRAGLEALCDRTERERLEGVAVERAIQFSPAAIAAAHAHLFREVFDG